MELQRFNSPDGSEENGYYDNFKQQHELWSMREWVLLTDILCWFESIKQLVFYTEVNRMSIRESFFNLKRHRNLFAVKKRFPANGYYVCLSKSSIGHAVDGVLQTLDFSSEDTKPCVVQNKYEILLQELGEMIYENCNPECKGIYSRESFERALPHFYWKPMSKA